MHSPLPSTPSTMSTTATHSVCIFCGSSPGAQPEYLEAANDIGQAIAQIESWRLVYGGGNRGIMGAVSASCLQAGGKVLGVIPKAMTVAEPRGHPTSKEGAGAVLHNPDDDKLGRADSIVVEDMHTRKRIMAQKANLGFVALPGGYGTFEEVFEMVTWTQLGIHRKRECSIFYSE
jgi:CCR4-NOT complex subunit CAF16